VQGAANIIITRWRAVFVPCVNVRESSAHVGETAAIETGKWCLGATSLPEPAACKLHFISHQLCLCGWTGGKSSDAPCYALSWHLIYSSLITQHFQQNGRGLGNWVINRILLQYREITFADMKTADKDLHAILHKKTEKSLIVSMDTLNTSFRELAWALVQIIYRNIRGTPVLSENPWIKKQICCYVISISIKLFGCNWRPPGLFPSSW
jgi:hypothetical protein